MGVSPLILAAASCLAAALSGLGGRQLARRGRLGVPELSAADSLSRVLYPVQEPRASGSLAVSNGYSIYWEEHGKEEGAPALFLHGGPGAGCARRHAGFFDPDHYRVVLHDQRGCGRSGPLGSTAANETPFLIEDIEALRVHLGIEKWACVLGGSWGTTLALEYAQAHPNRVASLVVRAVCLMRSSEVSWLFGERGGAARLSPAGWRHFAALDDASNLRKRHVELEVRDDMSVLQKYAEMLTGADDTKRAMAARKWMQWEASITGMGAALGQSATARPWAPPLQTCDPSLLAATPGAGAREDSSLQYLWRWDPSSMQWLCGDDVLDSSAVEHALSQEAFEARVASAITTRPPPVPPPLPVPPSPPPAPLPPASPPSLSPSKQIDDVGSFLATQTIAAIPERPQAPSSTPLNPTAWVPAQAILTCHYSVHSVHYGGFSGGDDGILSRIDRIRHIPCVAVQGGCDMICPPSTALDLHRVWPEMDLRIVTGDGHSMYSSGLQAQVMEATDKFRALSRNHKDGSPRGDFATKAGSPNAHQIAPTATVTHGSSAAQRLNRA